MKKLLLLSALALTLMVKEVKVVKNGKTYIISGMQSWVTFGLTTEGVER